VARLVQTVALEPVGPVALEGLSEPFELYALAPKLIT
jgi:hypothetical protein